MGCGLSYPNSIGIKIGSLKRGDEVTILKGEGYPPVKKETTTIIWQVDGYSALTVDGIALNCKNLSDVILTERRFETFHVTTEALQIWGEILKAQKEAQDGHKPDWTVPDPFSPEPE